MRFRSLESRIVVLFLVLIMTVQVAGFAAIHKAIEGNARKSIHTEVEIGERVFQRLLEQNAQMLTQSARLLAADYGFRQAIGSDDRETITSALQNHGARVGASIALFVGDDHQIKASTAQRSAQISSVVFKLIDQAEASSSAAGVGIFDNKAYQVVVVPVKAPLTVGWVAMAFPIDQRIANDMHTLSSLQMTVFVRDAGNKFYSNVTTLSHDETQDLARRLTALPLNHDSVAPADLTNNEFSIRVLTLANNGGQQALVVLQRSINEAIEPYRHLQMTLLILTALGLLIAVIASIFTAKRITGPLRQLALNARRVGAGDFKGQIAIKRDDEIGELSQAFDNMRKDISNRELEIRRLAYWDTLTGLPNRAQFVILLNEAILEAGRQRTSFYILIMNLDRFKNVNDVLGHSFGDALLQQVAQRLLSQIVGEKDQVARLGGDEFAILLPNITLDNARQTASRILHAFEIPLSLEEQTVDLGAGIGIAGYPDHGTDAEIVLGHAGLAMYSAKISGNEAVVYEPAMDKTSQQSLSLMSELRHAIEQNEFKLFVQPKILLQTGEVVGIEALLRWQHPQKGMVFPDNFIPFAEKTGFIRLLTLWALEQSAMLMRCLEASNLHPKMSVNLSARDLLDQDLPFKFSQILERNGVSAKSFCLEITESAIMDDPLRALSTLEGLHAMGVDLSIDDFGTGYSSLAYLKRLPVDELKIDKSFVMNMEKDEDDANIVRSTIDLGHNMGLRVVAEGVETQAAWNLLADMGCDQGQGYFISRPMPAERFAEWIGNWQPLMSNNTLSSDHSI